MTLMDDVKAKIIDFLRGYLADHAIDDDENIFATGYVNSLFVMQLVLMVEKEFSVVVEDEDLDIHNFRTVNAMAAFVLRKQAVLAERP
ncbi:acyl carrier protein [Nonomuraea sp. NPDC050404]|uniref:acyl carrier protein n=1 Tax=Nonomuraea sp. NPDC050404 TaxID=3155783 RepID=UPI0033E17C97